MRDCVAGALICKTSLTGGGGLTMCNNIRPEHSVAEFSLPEERLEFTGERYVSGHKGQTQNAHHHRYLFALEFCKNKDVLDVACGEGYGTYLLGNVSSSIVGVDIDEATVAFANRNYAKDNVSFVRAPAQSIPFEDKSFDVIVSFETIEHFEQHDEFLSEICRLLRDDGVLVISSPNKDIYSVKNKYSNPFHEKELDRSAFVDLMRAKFDNLYILFQRQICGSYIIPESSDTDHLEVYETLDGQKYERSGADNLAHYFIIVASNAKAPASTPSILSNDTYVSEIEAAARYGARRSGELEQQLKAAQSSGAGNGSIENLERIVADLASAQSSGAGNGTIEKLERIVADLASAQSAHFAELKSQIATLDRVVEERQRWANTAIVSLAEAGRANASQLRYLSEQVLSRLRKPRWKLWGQRVGGPKADDSATSPAGTQSPDLGIKLKAAWRYPFKATKRRAYRAKIVARLDALEEGRDRSAPDQAGHDAIGRVVLRLRAAYRYPLSSRRRRLWRKRISPVAASSMERSSLAFADVASGQPTGSTPAVAEKSMPASSAPELHARLFDNWVSNILGDYPATDFVPMARTAAPTSERDVQLIAYYLPQFHPIPENNKWWGAGFTEWRNVVRAYPQFEGHYQPRIPGELGYYDLRVVDVMRRQVELAKLYGISAFCFHFYWFAGKTLLETPIQNYLHNPDMDLPFCLCWANENWSRRWDGSEHEVLMSQAHSPEDDVAFLEYISKYFRDERYLKIDGRPVLTVYRPSLFPDGLATTQRWRETAKRLGYPDLYLIATNSFAFADYKSLGFDALSEFPPHHVIAQNVQNQFDTSKFRTGWRIRSYAEVVANEKSRVPVPGLVHPGIMMSWDNSARRPANGEIIHGGTPALFREWLTMCIGRAGQNPDGERLIFVNAWNEWAEGTYLEPDKRYGYAYLDACASALREHLTGPHLVDVRPGIPEWNTDAKTVLLCSHHAGRQVFGGERSFLDVLKALHQNGFNVVVTLQEAVNDDYIVAIRALAQEVRVFPYAQWTSDMSASLEAVPDFLSVIDQVKPDILYVNTIVVLSALVAAHLRGVPSIVHAREIISYDEELQRQIGRDGDAIVRHVKRVSNAVIANSRATAASFDVAAKFTIPNTIEPTEFDIPNEIGGSIVFGLISSNLPKKGIEDFVELARQCQSQVSRARFLVIGPLKRAIIQRFLTAELEYPANLEFIEYQPSSVDALRLVNVVVNFSNFQESFGRTVIEGMAARRPAIVYNWGALPELVEHGVNGFIVDYRRPADAVEWVQRLCSDSQLLRQMGAAARQSVLNNFSFSDFSAAIGDCVRETIGVTDDEGEIYATAKFSRLEAYQDTPIDIVVCIHNALDDVKLCLESVLKHKGEHHRLILVDDGSNEETRLFLQEFASTHPFVTLHRNEEAVGYTKAANIGMRLSTAKFMILLNSDTIVTALWAEKMLDAALSSPGVGIVGPLSNAASYQSIPSVQSTATQTAVNSLPPGFMPDDMNAWCEFNSTAAVPKVPLVHGFCFGLLREVWDEIGEFDEEAFPRGYGEENDYCLRATNAGFGLAVATHTYVFHAKSKSYSEGTRHEISQVSQNTLYDRHGKRRFMNAVGILAKQPMLVRLRARAEKLWINQVAHKNSLN